MRNIFLLLFVFSLTLGAKEYKAVFDCSSGDARYVKSRMWLINKTIDMIEQNGDTANFVITLHGSCVPMVSKVYDEIVADEDMKNIEQAQKYLTDLVKRRGVKVTACAMSLASNTIEQVDVLEFVYISENSFIDTIGFQNDGYALMTFN